MEKQSDVLWITFRCKGVNTGAEKLAKCKYIQIFSIFLHLEYFHICNSLVSDHQ